MKKYRILVIESSPIISAGFANILQSCADFEVVDVAEEMARIAERIIVCKPDLIVLDPQQIDFSKRMTFKAQLSAPSIPVVALVHTFCDSALLKHFDGVIEISDQRATIERKLSEVLQNGAEHTESADVNELSERELDVLVELSKGLTNKEIASDLHISVHTVITHRKNIIRKTGIKSVAGLTVYAMLNNLIKE